MLCIYTENAMYILFDSFNTGQNIFPNTHFSKEIADIDFDVIKIGQTVRTVSAVRISFYFTYYLFTHWAFIYISLFFFILLRVPFFLGYDEISNTLTSFCTSYLIDYLFIYKL